MGNIIKVVFISVGSILIGWSYGIEPAMATYCIACGISLDFK